MRWTCGRWVFALAVLAISQWVCAAEAPEPLRLASPVDYQVFQRGTLTEGVVHVRGSTAKAATRVEYRLVSSGGRPGEDWRAAKLEAGEFSADVPMAAGGWYEVRVRAMSGEVEIGAVSVAHVGVGEVFVVAGQSNSTNHGSEKQKPVSGFVVAFDGERWGIADDPQPGTHDRSKGGSFVPAFGDALYARLHVPIGVASTGQGSSSVRQWLPKGERMENEPTISKWVKPAGPGEWEASGELFDHLMRRVEALGPKGCRAVLWHQGESDAGQARAGFAVERQITGKQYTAFLETIIRASRKRAGWEVPWLVAKATYHSESDAADEEFRAAQRAVCDDGLALAGADTDSLGKDLRAGVHFNGRGLEAHGKQWADCVGAWIERQK